MSLKNHDLQSLVSSLPAKSVEASKAQLSTTQTTNAAIKDENLRLNQLVVA